MSALTVLAQQGAVVLDGGMGTLLQDLGLDDGGSGEAAPMSGPDGSLAIGSLKGKGR